MQSYTIEISQRERGSCLTLQAHAIFLLLLTPHHDVLRLQSLPHAWQACTHRYCCCVASACSDSCEQRKFISHGRREISRGATHHKMHGRPSSIAPCLLCILMTLPPSISLVHL